MNVPLHPDLEKDLALVGVLVQVSGDSCGVQESGALVTQLLPMLNGIKSSVVSMALWSILVAMAESARDRGAELIAADSAAKGPVN